MKLIHRIILTLLIAAVMLSSCNTNNNRPPLDKVKEKLGLTVKQRKLILIPYKGFMRSRALELKEKLKPYFTEIIVTESKDIPVEAYYKPRDRYRADSILGILNRTCNKKNSITIAISSEDISHTNGTIEDYGIMGLANCPGNCGVISDFRLKAGKKDEQLFKIAIHEIGHTEGLQHCSNAHCFMVDAEGKNKTDSLNDFCVQCKKHLNKLGWRVK